MKFRPCIDIHAGVVKQIVGSTLSDETSTSTGSSSAPPELVENFVATQSAGSFSKQYSEDGLLGGHIIMLGRVQSSCFLQPRLSSRRTILQALIVNQRQSKH